MAANKFATMLQRNTNKLTVILVYAVLEWFLIILLLLNSLFSYLITKFARFFGLKPPCPWCSRVDHVLERGKNTHSYRELFCENHAGEISKLGYCLNHGKLAETQTMCEDCLVSRPHHYFGSIGITPNLAFISWVSNSSSDSKVENGEDALRCSCCNGSLTKKPSPLYLLLKPSWGTANYVGKGELIVEPIDEEKDGDNNEHEHEKLNNGDHEDEGLVNEHQILSDIESFILREAAEDRSSSVSNLQYDEKDVEKDDNDDVLIITDHDPNIHNWLEEDASLQVIKLNSGKTVTCDTSRVIPVEVIDRFTLASPESCISEEDLKEETGHFDSARVNEGKLQGIDIGKNGVDISSLSNVEEEKKESILEAFRHSLATERVQYLPDEDNRDETVQTNPEKIHSDDQFQIQEYAASDTEEDQCSSSDDDADAEISNAFNEFMSQNNLRTHASESDTIPEIENIQIEKHHEEVGHQLCRAEVYETEDKIPDTPSSIDGLQYLHKKLMLHEKRESGAEDSLDGSVMSEMEGGDPGLTIERLKAALKAERKALSDLYQELEEERSASAIATNQTMAMIIRLQEEKATMQMEASQYQRMMEEQSEYDQEALQLLNELMVKREKEKEELEKELEVYRQKVIEYETIEKIRALRRMKNERDRSSRDSSSLCSDHGNSDEISIDLNREAREGDSDNYLHQENHENNASIDTSLNLEEMAEACVQHISTLDNSLAEFEEERLSILDQLKALEQKIISLGGDEEFIEEIKQIEQLSSYCAEDNNENNDFSSPEENGFLDDKEVPIRKTMGSLAKRLLPLLDAADSEIKDEENIQSACLQMQNPAMSKFDTEIDGRNLSLEEEVDHVYERLQALEADREFLKHCMSSVNMGDKGMNILQEILQHLRDLREAELRFKNMNSGMLQ